MILLETIVHDLRYAVRSLLRNPGYTAVSVFALALGIGVNTVALTAYKAFVARRLDARDPGKMVNFALIHQDGVTNALFSYPDYQAYRDQLRSFTGIIASSIEELRLNDTGDTVSRPHAEAGSLVGRQGLIGSGTNNGETVSAFIVSENFFSVLGIPATRGRTFESIPPAELEVSPSVLISENYWQTRFGGEPGVLGKSIRLNGSAFTIIGITPH